MSATSRYGSVKSAFAQVRTHLKATRFDEAVGVLQEIVSTDQSLARDLAAAVDETGYTLLCWAAQFPGSLPVLKTLVSMGAKSEVACGADHILTKLVLADTNFGTSSTDEIKFLISEGANPNAIAVGAGSYPLLHFAIRENRLGAVRILLECGANPLARTGETNLDAETVAKRYNKRALPILASFGTDRPIP